MDYGELSERALDETAAVLRRGGIVAAATETLVGLLVDARRSESLDRLWRLKRRAAGRPFPLLVPDVGAVESLAAAIPPLARRAIAAFWPGPLTLLLPARPGLPAYIVGREGMVAVRLGGPSVAASVCRRFGAQVTATSANVSGRLAPASAGEMETDIVTGVDLVIGGRAPGGPPSTIVSFGEGGYSIVREGAVPASMIRGALE